MLTLAPSPLRADDDEILIEDHFCGAGGSTTGALRVEGTRVVHAANHSKRSIETHSANYPDVEHSLADIPTMDPARDAPRAHILITTPECKAHSYARGRPKDDTSLFDPTGGGTAERSRATMWEVPRWAEVRQYPVIIVENVPQMVDWCGIESHTPKPSDKCNCGASYVSWMKEMRKLGYDHRIMWLNSMFFPPTPQSRDRVYHVFWKRELAPPALDWRPVGWCPECETLVNGVQTFKPQAKPRFTDSARPRPCRYDAQYYYACGCGARINPAITPAATAIDWTVPAVKIKDRERPLAAGTMTRIRRGLELMRRRPAVAGIDGTGLVVHVGGNLHEKQNQVRATPLDAPMKAVTCTSDRAIVVSNMAHGVPKGSDTQPMGTVTTGNKLYVCEPMVVPYRENAVARPALSEPMPACTTITSLYLLDGFTVQAGGNPAKERHLSEPLNTFTGSETRGIVIANYGSPDGPKSKQGWARRADEDPFGTLTTRDSHALVTMRRGVGDDYQVRELAAPMATQTERLQQAVMSLEEMIGECTFRMFEPHEIGAGMVMRHNAWGAPYVVHGTRREQVQQYGNAVTPPVMEWLVSEVSASLRGDVSVAA